MSDRESTNPPSLGSRRHSLVVDRDPTKGTSTIRAKDETITREHSLHDPREDVNVDVKSRNEDEEPTQHLELDLQGVLSKNIVSFSYGDPENPQNWSERRKGYCVVTGAIAVTNNTLGSSLPSNAMPYISSEFGIINAQALVLPISMYLLGYVFGPPLFGPLSEHFGRRWPMIACFVPYTLFTLGCALAPNYAALLVFRLLCGMVASGPIAIVGGIYADVHGDPRKRGKAIAYYNSSLVAGPVFGAIFSGFISPVSWRWTFWLGLIIAGVSLPFIIFLPETYGPIILERRARRLRHETGNQEFVAPKELEKKGARQLITVTLTRPIRMITSEAIVLFTCLYVSLVYAMFYVYFQAFPIIYEGIYGMSAGIGSLAFLPLLVGSMLAIVVFLLYDMVLEKAKMRNAPWAHNEDYRRLPVACIGGPIFAAGLFWLGWSADRDVHWIVPILSGVPLGLAFLMVGGALMNYLTDAYQTFSASAHGACSASRSIFAAVLPLATKPMFDRLGVDWALSLIGFVSLAMCVIPFAFIRYGKSIRAHSKFCQYLVEVKMKEQAAEERERERRRLAGEEEKSEEGGGLKSEGEV